MFCLRFASKREEFLAAVFEFAYAITPFQLKTFWAITKVLLFSYQFFFESGKIGPPTPLGPTALVQCATLWAFSRHEINDPSLDPGKYYCLLRLCVGDTVEKCVKFFQKQIFTLRYLKMKVILSNLGVFVCHELNEFLLQGEIEIPSCEFHSVIWRYLLNFGFVTVVLHTNVAK